jgi:hypothetical protein
MSKKTKCCVGLFRRFCGGRQTILAMHFVQPGFFQIQKLQQSPSNPLFSLSTIGCTCVQSASQVSGLGYRSQYRHNQFIMPWQGDRGRRGSKTKCAVKTTAKGRKNKGYKHNNNKSVALTTRPHLIE